MNGQTPHPGAFYATARGAIAARVLREHLSALWPPAQMNGLALLGFGYTAPYLRLWREAARRAICVTPPHLGAMAWPNGAPNLACTAEEDALPFADLSFDRIVLVHGLETADHARRLLRETWRVLKDDGRLLVVTPNRRGLWAHLESTPFGQGEPYTAGQIDRLLASCLFAVEQRQAALFVPPVSARLVLRTAPLLERAGAKLMPRFAGLTLTEATKNVYAAIPRRAQRRRRLVIAEA